MPSYTETQPVYRIPALKPDGRLSTQPSRSHPASTGVARSPDKRLLPGSPRIRLNGVKWREAAGDGLGDLCPESTQSGHSLEMPAGCSPNFAAKAHSGRLVSTVKGGAP
jgi:hypothetical protein